MDRGVTIRRKGVRINVFLLAASIAGITILLIGPFQISWSWLVLALLVAFAFDQLGRALVSMSFRDGELRVVNYWRAFRIPIADARGFRMTKSRGGLPEISLDMRDGRTIVPRVLSPWDDSERESFYGWRERSIELGVAVSDLNRELVDRQARGSDG